MHDDTAATSTTVVEFDSKQAYLVPSEPGCHSDEQEMSLYVDNLLTGEDAVEPRPLCSHPKSPKPAKDVTNKDDE